MKRLPLLLVILGLMVIGLAPDGSAAAPDQPGAQHDAGAAHSADAQDSHDAGHGEVNPIPSPAAGIITSLTTFLIFVGLIVILSRYAWGPIVAGLKAREDKIRADIESAERARAQADEARRQFEQQLATAEERVRQMLARAQSDGQQLATRIRTQAQEEAEEESREEPEGSALEALEQMFAEIGCQGKIATDFLAGEEVLIAPAGTEQIPQDAQGGGHESRPTTHVDAAAAFLAAVAPHFHWASSRRRGPRKRRKKRRDVFGI